MVEALGPVRCQVTEDPEMSDGSSTGSVSVRATVCLGWLAGWPCPCHFVRVELREQRPSRAESCAGSTRADNE